MNGEQMRYADITKEVLKSKEPRGKTPSASLRATLSGDKRFANIDQGF